MNEKEYKILLNAIESIFADNELEKIFSRIFKAVKELVPCFAVSLLLKDEKTGEYRINVSLGLSEEYVKQVSLKKEEDIIYNLSRKRSPLIIDDVLKYMEKIDPISVPYIEKEGIHSVVILPILRENDLMGTMHLYFSDKYTPSNEEMNKLKLFTRYGAIAIDKANVIKEKEMVIERLKAIHRIGRHLVTSRTLKKLLNVIKKEVLQITKATNMFIALYDKKRGVIQFVLDTDIKAQGGVSERKLSSGLTEWVIRNKKPLLLHSMDKNERKKYNIKSFGRVAKSWLGVPIIYKDKVYGVMAIQDYDQEGKFSEYHKELLLDIANESAIAIENAKLYEKLKKLAITDGLTGLYNRRYFYRKLSSMIRKNSIKEKIFSLSLLDLDNFKYCNDRYGHTEGDRILSRVGKYLINLGKTKGIIPFRYGGDEFAIIFSMHKEEALKYLNKLLKKVKISNNDCSVTMSGGLVEYPVDGIDLDEIIHKCDMLLYRAKRNGGDVIEI